MTEVELRLMRHAVSPRHVARAGEIWRMCQEAAIRASSAAGWPPPRFAAEEVGFVVSQQTVRHHRELSEADSPRARTWVADFRRGTLSRREVRLSSDGEPVAAASQQWVHVAEREGALRPVRASPELLAAFQPDPEAPAPLLLPPVEEELAGPERQWEFRCWHGWMDPLAHANHPLYVDWCDEALAIWLAELDVDPAGLRPVAEQLRFRGAALGGMRLRLRSRLVGRSGPIAAIDHRVELAGEERLLARGRSLRALVDRSLPELLGG